MDDKVFMTLVWNERTKNNPDLILGPEPRSRIPPIPAWACHRNPPVTKHKTTPMPEQKNPPILSSTKPRNQKPTNPHHRNHHAGKLETVSPLGFPSQQSLVRCVVLCGFMESLSGISTARVPLRAELLRLHRGILSLQQLKGSGNTSVAKPFPSEPPHFELGATEYHQVARDSKPHMRDLLGGNTPEGRLPLLGKDAAAD